MNARIFPMLLATAWCSLVAAQPAATPAAPPAASSHAPPSGPDAVQPSMRDDRETIEASKAWLANLDAGKLGPAWDTSSAYLKSVVTRKQWVAEIGAARKPFGKLSERTAEKFARAHSFPGAPEGDYSIVEFDSVFANGKRASEQVIWALEENDVWRVSGYFIR